MSSPGGDGPHCPGCRGYTADWAVICPGLVVPGGARELIEAEITAYETDRELGNPGSLPDRIVSALTAVGLLQVTEQETGDSAWADDDLSEGGCGAAAMPGR